jgi:rubrerythrin
MKTKLIYFAAIVAITISGITNVLATGTNQKTVKNLQDAYVGESTASAKYAAFAKKAREEGYSRVAILFEAASKAESIHASNHKAVLKQLGGNVPKLNPKIEVKSTMENLKVALEGESYEISTMYPDFLKKAQEEKVQLALISLNYAYKTEIKHKALYKKAIEALKSGNEKSLPGVYSVCSTCGNTYDRKAPERCGISMTPKERFIKFSL